ncbi:MAG TPA: PAS domain-containing sensor histidine kinase [Verrucomicrobiae bacterium]|nr:PAS domain-containing sensor histidine kinase [Verrucomicrobiae bacterium]
METQNAALRASQLDLDESVSKYADLYDFAPVGYFSFDRRGRILEVNLTGARLLGMERRRLVGQPFVVFVTRESRPAFFLHLRRIFKNRSRELCDLALLRADTPFHVQLETVWREDRNQGSRCSTAIMEIDARKRAEDALREAHEDLESRVQQRTAELLQTNQALEAEIVQRRQAEESHLRVLRSVVATQEAERGRLARELHNEFSQKLAALGIGLKGLGEELPSPSPLQLRLADLLNVVDGLMRDMHTLVWKLRPPVLDDLGLLDALRRYTRDWMKVSGIPVDFHSRGFGGRVLAPQLEITLYRIAQEALTNVFKHARATRVSVLLEDKRNHVALIIEDDGRGFRMDKLSNDGAGLQDHLGLIDMRERAALAGGTVEIESAPRSGTTIFVRIPLAAQPRKGEAAK